MRVSSCAGLAGPHTLASLVAWVGLTLAAGCGAHDEDAERGKLLLAQYQCTGCHVIPGVSGIGSVGGGARGHAGPPLHRFGRRSYIAGEIPNRSDTLARWIEAPATLVPGTRMPDMGASAADARDMAAYLGTLR